MLSRVTAKNVGDVFLRHTVHTEIIYHAASRVVKNVRYVL